MPPAYSGGASKGEERVRKALGAIRDLEEVEAHMTPTAPELAADGLHPVIWQSAAVTWNTGQYRVAIGQASLALATQIKARAKSKLSDRKLVQDVFSSGPPKDGRLRLHFPGDREEESWRSRQDGLHMLAQGAHAGIRNISAHEDEEWSEQQALEYLAGCLSLHGGLTKPKSWKSKRGLDPAALVVTVRSEWRLNRSLPWRFGGPVRGTTEGAARWASPAGSQLPI